VKWYPGGLRVPLAAILVVLAAGSPAAPRPTVILPRQALGPRELAVIVNDLDPTSGKIAAYYAARRHIPTENIIHVRLPPHRSQLSPDAFRPVYATAQAATQARVQAYALTWAAPYRVGCMSITTAFAVGYDETYCAKGCEATRPSPYFASASHSPYTDFELRPTMALAGTDFQQTKALIDRGVASDDTHPAGTGYLVNTSDRARSVRAVTFNATLRALRSAVNLERVDADYIENRPDVLFYVTGLASVPKIKTNHYLPGAVADHLTSTGGQLTDSRQMSALRWLEAGATGSYGTVVEPCNFPAKFPQPGILIASYLDGATLIEAYWKSVQMPGQGIFIGEPLARPYGGYELIHRQDTMVLELFGLDQGRYQLQAAESAVGPYRTVSVFTKPGVGSVEVALPDMASAYYRVTAAPHRADEAPFP
jgi:uncharacterized protein (TIGR03790 family)